MRGDAVIERSDGFSGRRTLTPRVRNPVKPGEVTRGRDGDQHKARRGESFSCATTCEFQTFLKEW